MKPQVFILNALCRGKHIYIKKKRIAAHLAAVSPAGSVGGASASQRCPPDTRTAMTAIYI